VSLLSVTSLLLQQPSPASHTVYLQTTFLQVSNPSRCTRPHFEWANALLVVAVEQLLGFDCDLAAQEVHLKEVAKREYSRTRAAQVALNPLMFERMEAKVQHER
jgi:hypothetical protein